MGYFNRTMPEEAYYLALAKRPRPATAFSQYRGVTRGTGKEPYRAQLTYKGRRYYLGGFQTEIEAAQAYNKAALAIIGPHAVINDL